MRVIDYAARARNERMFIAENKRREPIQTKKFICGSCFDRFATAEECITHQETCTMVARRWEQGIVDGYMEEK